MQDLLWVGIILALVAASLGYARLCDDAYAMLCFSICWGIIRRREMIEGERRALSQHRRKAPFIASYAGVGPPASAGVPGRLWRVMA